MAITRKTLEKIGFTNIDGNDKFFRGGVTAHLADGTDCCNVNNDSILRRHNTNKQLAGVTIRGTRYNHPDFVNA